MHDPLNDHDESGESGRTWRLLRRLLVPCCCCLAVTLVAMNGSSHATTARDRVPVLRHVAGSTVKVQQLLGERDLERNQPTLSRTVTRYGLAGTDLGSSFEHEGRLYFLFGDTVGLASDALDTIGFTDARVDPEAGVRLDFLTRPGPTRLSAGRTRGGGSGAGGARSRAPEQHYLTIEPPGISMGAFEVPVAGLSLGGRMYVVVSTNHQRDRKSDRSVLTTFTPPATFRPGRTLSQLPAGRFVKLALREAPGPVDGLPAGGPFVFLWGTGVYRQSDAYFAVVPASTFENGQGTRYFAGLDAAGRPAWSEKEDEAKPVVRSGAMGEVSVIWCAPLDLWLMTFDSRPPAAPGIQFAYSRTPWGPWSPPQTIFHPLRDPGLGVFIHNPRGSPPDNLVGPVIGPAQQDPQGTHGGAYAPYMIERWTKVQGKELTIYYVMSTWNPYVVVLMRSKLRVE